MDGGPTQNAVTSAMHGETSRAWIARQPVVLGPDVYVVEALEVAGLVFAVSRVAPKEARHAWEGFADDHLARLAGVVDRGAGRGVYNIDVHAESADLHLAGVDGSGWVEGYQRCGGVCAAGGVADLDARWEAAVEPAVLLW